MRHLKILGIAVIATFSLVAFVGATTASATRLCATNTTPCANVYPNDSTFTAHLVPATTLVITTSGGSSNPTLSCNSSTMGLTNANTGGAAGVAATTRLNALSFSNCSSVNPTGCGSTFQVGSLAGTDGIINSTAGRNGTLQLTPPLIGWTCAFLGVNVQCTYGGSGTLDATVTGGSPAIIEIRNQTLAGIGGFGCQTLTTWNATYQTTSALYVTSS
jgi:hypothetical protein